MEWTGLDFGSSQRLAEDGQVVVNVASDPLKPWWFRDTVTTSILATRQPVRS